MRVEGVGAVEHSWKLVFDLDFCQTTQELTETSVSRASSRLSSGSRPELTGQALRYRTQSCLGHRDSVRAA
ncbi:hypothetical protein NXC24_PB00038 (plasmid) [Rhizobium sp. NXC24]|nr:hypothetical protein NXC24_PB00038 [Rhizobium sp. NXC24]